jgi:hypothetical protein
LGCLEEERMSEFEHYDNICSLKPGSILRVTGTIEVLATDQVGITRFFFVVQGGKIKVINVTPSEIYGVVSMGENKMRKGRIEVENWHRLKVIRAIKDHE